MALLDDALDAPPITELLSGLTHLAETEMLSDVARSKHVAIFLHRLDRPLGFTSAEVTLGGSLALERAIARALTPPNGVGEDQTAQVLSAVDRLTITIASSWASALAGRGARPVGRVD